MKKLINLVSLVVLTSVNVFTPFSYAQFDEPVEIQSTGLQIMLSDEKTLPLNGNGGELFTFQDMTITDGTKTFTIMDRNLGATSNDIESEDSYGYYYQWGNNYGFGPNFPVNIGYDTVDASNYGPNNYYESSKWISVGSDGAWDNTYNNNLWGGSGDRLRFRGVGTDIDRQGPCPENYHIPSIVEYKVICNTVCDDSKENCNYFCNNGYFFQLRSIAENLKIPTAGYMRSSKNMNWNTHNYYTNFGFSNEGSNFFVWSTSPYSHSHPYNYNGESYGFMSEYNYKYKSNGLPIRCIKNFTQQTQTFTLKINTNGGKWKYNPYIGNTEYREIDSDTINIQGTLGWRDTYIPQISEPYKYGSEFLGWYTEDGKEWDFENDKITGDMILHAVWQPQTDWENYYENGYIELTNGDETIVIKDKNQGAEISMGQVYEIENLRKEYEECYGNPLWQSSDNIIMNIPDDRECHTQDEILNHASRILSKNVSLNDLLGINENFYSQLYQQTYGNYYYWGNNTGATWDELGVYYFDGDPYVNISDEVMERGFDGGLLGIDENNGWIQGNEQNNPCDPNKGEYLPNVDDWIGAMEMWSELHGDNLNYDNGYIYYEPSFLNNILVPNAGYVQYTQAAVVYLGSWDYIAFTMNSPSVWTSLSNDGKIGRFDDERSRYYYRNIDEYDYDNINAKAMPVRCFINPDYVEQGEKYTVTFKDGDEELFTKQVKEGKTIKNVKEPSKEGLGLVGWYTSNGTKWDFDTDTVNGDITLYAKWAEKGVFHKDGYIKVTDGKNTIYVSDKNVGVSDAAVNLLRFNQLWDRRDYECQNSSDNACRSRKYMNGTGEINELLGTQYSDILEAETDIYSKVLEGLLTPEEMDYFTKYRVVDRNYIGAQCDLEGYPDNCYDDKWLDYINGIMGNETEDFEEYEDVDDARDAIYDKYGDDVVGKDYWSMLGNQPNGNYYYRGNNNGVSYNDLEFGYDENDNWVITNTGELISNGFNGGKIGVEGEGWIEGNPNPCDASKGEYLPTPEDWKNLMKIWGNANDYELEGEEEGTYNYEGIDYTEYEYRFDPDLGVKMQSDLLLPAGGSIYETTCGNDEEPCVEWSDGLALRASQDNEGKMGAFYRGGVSYTHYNVRLDDGYRPDNTQAVPVRCFLNITEPEDEEEQPAPSTPTPTYTPSYGGSSGGGRTGVTKTDEDKAHGSADDQKPETQKEPEKQDTPKIPEIKPWENLVDDTPTNTQPNNSHGSATSTTSTPAPTYTAEFKSAYSFAKTYGITNKETIQDAKMYTELTRIQMAKMLSQYAINVLGQTPDYSRGVVSFNDVSNKLNKEYDNAVTLAYQLGIMGINMKNNNFRPRDTVTRAEFATALSRMLYGIEDGTGKTKYYEPHIAKLYNEGIINNTNAKMTEKRGYVMTMLMRTVR